MRHVPRLTYSVSTALAFDQHAAFHHGSVTAMDFCLLGPLVVLRGATMVPVQAGKQRAVLAMLLLNANRVVPLEELAETLWGSAPPRSARVTVQNYVVRLRKALGEEGRSRIGTQPRGYVISVAASELDMTRFEVLLGAARQAARDGSWEIAAAQARTALALWRGEPLADVESELLARREVPRLADLRLLALETRIDGDLHLGCHAEVIGELRQLAAAHPLREHLHALLMLALHRDGRQAEALAAYQNARRVLLEELGTEPGRELRGLHQQILAADPALDLPAPPEDDAGPPAVSADLEQDHAVPTVAIVPRQLPAVVRHFTGRQAELAELTALLDTAREDGTAVAVAVIDGAPGLGKTALAVNWAHRAAARFPDGQLYVNLQGFDPSGEIVLPGTAIRGFLDAFGIPAERVPASPESQAALYRSLLAGRRVLIVADNARDAGQVRPLLPGSPGCVLLVTSRNRLTGLAAGEGARLLTLDVLPTTAAQALLASRIGVRRARAEPGAVEQLARLCGRLPLALTVAAALAAARPKMPLAAAAAELADAAGRLKALETGDPVTDIRTVFSWSCQHLEQLPARMFRLLSVHPGPDITVPAAAALLNVTRDSARDALGALAMANLVGEHVAGRFALHDLLRAYAAEQAAEHEPAAERRAAIERVLDYYLHTGHAAALLLDSTRDPISLAEPPPGVTPERLVSSQQALAWFEAEHRVLIAAIATAEQARFDARAWQLPWTMDSFLNWRGHWLEWAAAQRTALAAATRLGDAVAQATAHNLLAHAHASLGDYAEASAHLTECLSLCRQLGDEIGQARAHQSLGVVAEHKGRPADALGHAQQALALCEATGNQVRLAAALNNLGWCLALTGDYPQAQATCRQAVALHRQLGHRRGEANAYDSLGYAEYKLGNLIDAADCHRRALRIAREFGDRHFEAEVRTHLGDVHHAAGDPRQARDYWQQALDILDDLHHPGTAQIRAKLSQHKASLQRSLARPDPDLSARRKESHREGASARFHVRKNVSEERVEPIAYVPALSADFPVGGER
jgi:DNA-binding SARP family transcriptional activator/tetratricopeptide (TPR) repeat protein